MKKSYFISNLERVDCKSLPHSEHTEVAGVFPKDIAVLKQMNMLNNPVLRITSFMTNMEAFPLDKITLCGKLTFLLWLLGATMPDINCTMF